MADTLSPVDINAPPLLNIEMASIERGTVLECSCRKRMPTVAKHSADRNTICRLELLNAAVFGRISLVSEDVGAS